MTHSLGATHREPRLSEWFTPPISNCLNYFFKYTIMLNRNIYIFKCSVEIQKRITVFHIQICTYLTFLVFFFFFCYLPWELVPTDLSTWKTLYSALSIFQWHVKRRTPHDEGLQPCPSGSQLPVTRESTFFLRAGVNPPPLVKSPQGLFLWGIKRQPVWGPFSSPTEPFVTGDTPPPGIFQCSSNPRQAQCTWPCSMTGAALPQAKGEEIQKMRPLSRLFFLIFFLLHSLHGKTPMSVDQNTY